MCGIFGIISSGTHIIKTDTLHSLMDALITSSTSRGKDAAGVSLWDGKEIHILKAPVPGTKLVNIPDWFRFKNNLPHNQPFSFIGHTRLATNGNPDDNRNNQPLAGKYCVGVHNGIIVNSNKILTSFKLETETNVDTESILVAYDRFIDKGNTALGALQRTFSVIRGAATIGIQSTQEPLVIISTNTGSLYMFARPTFPVVFASEERILRHSLLTIGIEDTQNAVQQVPARTYIEINCLTGKMAAGILQNACVSRKHTKTAPVLYPTHQLNRNGPIHSFTPVNSLKTLKYHSPDYRKVRSLRRCKKCILPETMPLITFDRKGICNYCNTYTFVEPLGMAALEQVIAPFRSNNGKPDCILAFSGGRDSAYGLHLVKKILKLNPVAYTYDWGMVTDIARRNQSRLTAALGIEHIVVSADLKLKRQNIKKNILAWLRKPDLGMVTLFMAGDKQAEYYAEQLSRDMNIPLVLYCRGNHLEDERFKFGYFGIFDGTPGGVIHNTSALGKIKMIMYAGSQYIRNPAYINTSILDTSFAYFSTYIMRHSFRYLWNFLPWEEKTVVATLKQQYGWETPKDTISTWRVDDGSPPFYNYIYYRVQGFTENDAFRSNQIREGLLSRTKALELVYEENKPRYEGLQWYFDTLELDGNDVLTQVDRIPLQY